MADVTLTGRWGKIQENMRTLIANSAFFRTWTSSADVAAAKGHIFLRRALESGITRPAVCVYWSGDSVLMAKAAGPNFGIWPEGDIVVRFEANIATGTYEKLENQINRFIEDVEGKVVEEMIVLIQGGKYLQIDSIAQEVDIEMLEPITGENVPIFTWEWRFGLSGFGT